MPMPAQPVAVQARRERMADRPAHHAGEQRPAGQVAGAAAHRAEHALHAQELEQLEQRQALDREMVALDAGEQLRAQPLDLIGADRAQRQLADGVEIARRGTRPSTAAATAATERPRARSGHRRESPRPRSRARGGGRRALRAGRAPRRRSRGLSNQRPSQVRIWSAPSTMPPRRAARDGAALSSASASAASSGAGALGLQRLAHLLLVDRGRRAARRRRRPRAAAGRGSRSPRPGSAAAHRAPAGRGRARQLGSRISTRRPPSGASASSMSPPWPSTMSRAMVRPSPTPPVLGLRDGSRR